VGEHVRDGRVDVGDVERDVMTRPVGVLRERRHLVGRVVLEELDVGAATTADHRDLLDHRSWVDAEQVLHERAGRVAERAEGQRRAAAEHALEPRDRLVDVGDRDPNVIHPDETQLPRPVPLRGGRPSGR
jgi:hypothetical protein